MFLDPQGWVRIVVLSSTLACGGAPGSSAGSPDGGAMEDRSVRPPDAEAWTDVNPFADVAFPTAAAYADVGVPANFTSPVWLPPPDTNIEGDLTDLVGSWVQVNATGAACTPANWTSGYLEGVVCIHIEIQKGPSGGFVGSIHGLRSSSPPSSSSPDVYGPFAPATNPDVGYPPKLSPNDYSNAKQFIANVPYQILDGVMTNGSLTFWFSPIDLWTGWCALQTPSVWHVGSKEEFRCVAQNADPTTDLGKLALCTSADDGPMCTDVNGVHTPCACLNDAGVVSATPTLCTRTVCECSASQCRADLRSSEINVAVTLESGQLVGTIDFGFPPGPAQPTTFIRATP
jgi:hypothetical protein